MSCYSITPTMFDYWQDFCIPDDDSKPLLYKLIDIRSLAVFYYGNEYRTGLAAVTFREAFRADGAGGLMLEKEGEGPIHLKLALYGKQWYAVKCV